MRTAFAFYARIVFAWLFVLVFARIAGRAASSSRGCC